MLQFILLLAVWLLWPVLPAWALQAGAAAAAYVAYKVLVHGRAREGEPAFETGLLPWVGLGVEMGRRGASHFLSGMRRRHGDVFAVYLAGRRHVFVLDPLSSTTVFRDQRLSFQPVSDAVMAAAFGVPAALAGAGADALHRQYKKYLLGGEELGALSLRMSLKLRERVAAERAAGGAAAGPGSLLYDFCSRVMFAAAADTVFGDGAATEDGLALFREFDSQFAALVAGAPALGAVGRAVRARDALRAVVGTEAHRSRENTVAWMEDRHRTLLGDEGLDEDTKNGFQLAILWALHGNTIPAAFWTVAHVAAEGPALARDLRAELRAAGGLARARADPALLEKLPLLQSCITETLRLVSDSMVLREAADDCEIRTHPTPDEKGGSRAYRVRRGDRVCLYPQLTHTDSALFPEPYRFVPRRFLDPAAAAPRLRGLVVRNAVMPFAGGRCPGRKFARNEIALLCCELFASNDVRLGERTDKAERAPLPDFDRSRGGLGILLPLQDVTFELVPAKEPAL